MRLILFFMILVSAAGCAGETHTVAIRENHEQTDAAVFRQLAQEFSKKNTLKHLRVRLPENWRLGVSADSVDCILIDFPLLVNTVDYAIFTQPLSDACIAVAYKPILGRTANDSSPEMFVQDFLRWLVEGFVANGVDIDRKELEQGVIAIGGRPIRFCRIAFRHKKRQRITTLLFDFSESVKSVNIFGLSHPPLPKEDGGRLYQQLVEIAGRAINLSLDPYDEALYRTEQKLWMGISPVGAERSDAIRLESIGELRQAASLSPKRWEAHFALANAYYDLGYFFTEGADIPIGQPKAEIRTGNQMVPAYRLDPEKALEEFKLVVGLNAPPRVITESYYRILDILEDTDRGAEFRNWAKRAANDKAVRSLASRGDFFAESILSRAK